MISKNEAILYGVFIPVGIVLLMILICFIIRRLRSNHVYSQVNHELDEEEIEFKRIIDQGNYDNGGRSTQYDEEEEDDDDDDITFNSKELNSLNMLENYRNNLVAGANATLKSDDLRL